jgi:ribosomal-protein-alanine N-acetyltransferase
VTRLPSAASLRITRLTREHAVDICTWSYPAPYDCYDMTRADPDLLLSPAAVFHALVAEDRLVGFRSFGADGQVPGWEYDDRALDTGGGLRPDLVGHGLGRAAVAVGLAFGRAELAPPAFRMTVASFNARALRTVESLGFRRVGRFDAARDGRSFEVLLRPEP